jgi:protein-disulfide isomerase
MPKTTQKNASGTRSQLPVILGALSLVGALISLWQTRLFFLTRTGTGGFKSFCNMGQTFDCTAVEMSNYAEILPGIPLSGFAVAGYTLLLGLSLCGLSPALRRNLKPWLVGFSGVALIFSLIYLFVMLTQIGKLCLLCLVIDSLNLILFVLALTLPSSVARSEPSGSGIRLSHIAAMGSGSLIVAFLFTQALNPQAGVKRSDLDDIVDSVMQSPSLPIEIPADAPTIGAPDAPVTIIKFTDYECPACKMGATAIHPLFKRYPKKVRFVFMNFPLAHECNADPQLNRTIHAYACEAAAVAVCAKEQGKFTEAYETLFDNQTSFKANGVADLVASKVEGLDSAKLKECMKLPSTADRIRRESLVGVNLKVQSTPTFFINGKKVEGGMPTNVWVQIIEKMIQN